MALFGRGQSGAMTERTAMAGILFAGPHLPGRLSIFRFDPIARAFPVFPEVCYVM